MSEFDSFLQAKEASQAEEEKVPCPYCGETINASAKKCRFCGELLDEEERKRKAKEKNGQVIVKNFTSVGGGCFGCFLEIVGTIITLIIVFACMRGC